MAGSELRFWKVGDEVTCINVYPSVSQSFYCHSHGLRYTSILLSLAVLWISWLRLCQAGTQWLSWKPILQPGKPSKTGSSASTTGTHKAMHHYRACGDTCHLSFTHHHFPCTACKDFIYHVSIESNDNLLTWCCSRQWIHLRTIEYQAGSNLMVFTMMWWGRRTMYCWGPRSCWDLKTRFSESPKTPSSNWMPQAQVMYFPHKADRMMVWKNHLFPCVHCCPCQHLEASYPLWSFNWESMLAGPRHMTE